MNKKTNTVLIVDDSSNDIHFLVENLKHEYTVLAATSGKKALDILSGDKKPDIIIMDVLMPDLGGYETCRRIKANSDTENIDIIFVSAHESIDEKLAGYEVGGCDYMVKPVSPVELLKKIQMVINNRDERLALEVEKKLATETAMTAISSTGELGVVLGFLKSSFLIATGEELGRLIVESIEHYFLNCIVQIRSFMGEYNFATNEPISSFEKELLWRLKDAGRIRQQGDKLVLNYGDLSIIIKNMPLDNVESCGRIRDNVAFLAEGGLSRLRAIEAGFQMKQQKIGLHELIVESNKSLSILQEAQEKQKLGSLKIMDEVMSKMEDSFLLLGLTEDQETSLLNIVQSGVSSELENFEQGIKADDELRNITQKLQRFIDD